ncbi:MAG: hypothetical protein JHD16_02515 [Solirubrobacteraceae bacterium]|nr:hypothetical protein [Solirubrobacteraceae bacterium]
MVAKDNVSTRHFLGLQRPRTSWFVALAAVLAEAALALAGAGTLALAGAALLAPGVALVGLLPMEVRRTPMARWALVPALGMAASSVALISIARLGIPLTGVSIRVVIVALLIAGLFVNSTDITPTVAPPGSRTPRQRLAGVVEALALSAVLIGAAALAWRVLGELPLPGNDWAKYLLYADEIRQHHRLLIDNPVWLGGQGVPFREDPGVPSLQGSALILSGSPTGELARTIMVLSLGSVLAVYGSLRASLGAVGAITAAALIAFIPASQNILGWHGLANVGALVLLPLVLGQLGAWLSGGLDRRGEVGLALVLVALAASHRLTSVIGLAVVLVIIGVRWVAPGGVARGAVVKSALRLGGLTALLGLLVLLDIQARSATAGGTLDYKSYLSTKLDLELASRDLGTILLVTAGLSAVWLLARRRLPRAVWPALALTVVSFALAYVWIIHLPLYYARMVFYLPFGLAPLAGAGAAALVAALVARDRGTLATRTPIAVAAAAGVGLAALLYVPSARQADQVQQYYAFANPASLRGLDALAASMGPNEPVTTDRCWSFLSGWLLHRPTYPALADQDIGPKAEVPLARKGRAMMADTDEGRALIRELGVRYALVDPACPPSDVEVRPAGQLVYASERLAIVRLTQPK